jgi:hypothetical protein
MGGFSIAIFDYQRMFDSKNCQVYLWHFLTRGPASPAPPADGCTSNPLFAKLCPGACWSSIHSATLGWWPWNATALRHSTLQKLALLEQDPVEAWDALVSYGFSTFKANFWRIFGSDIFWGETPVGSPQFVWSVRHWIRIMQCPARRRSKSTKLGKSWGPQDPPFRLGMRLVVGRKKTWPQVKFPEKIRSSWIGHSFALLRVLHRHWHLCFRNPAIFDECPAGVVTALVYLSIAQDCWDSKLCRIRK